MCIIKNLDKVVDKIINNLFYLYKEQIIDN